MDFSSQVLCNVSLRNQVHVRQNIAALVRQCLGVFNGINGVHSQKLEDCCIERELHASSHPLCHHLLLNVRQSPRLILGQSGFVYYLECLFSRNVLNGSFSLSSLQRNLCLTANWYDKLRLEFFTESLEILFGISQIHLVGNNDCGL